jgi:hypothetical protein
VEKFENIGDTFEAILGGDNKLEYCILFNKTKASREMKIKVKAQNHS